MPWLKLYILTIVNNMNLRAILRLAVLPFYFMDAYNLQSIRPLPCQLCQKVNWAEGQSHTFDIHQGAQLDFAWIMMLSVYGRSSVNES